MTPRTFGESTPPALQIIETVGIKFPSQRALEIWAEAGADVDFDRMIVKASRLIEFGAPDRARPPTLGLPAIPSRICRSTATMSIWEPTVAEWR